MTSPVKDQIQTSRNVVEEGGSIFSKSAGSRGNKQTKSDASQLENGTHKSVIDHPDSCPSDGKPLNTESIDNPEKKSSGNSNFEPNNNAPDGIFKSELVNDSNIKSPNSENPQTETNQDCSSTERKLVGEHLLDKQASASAEVSEKDSFQSQPRQISDNGSPISDDSGFSPETSSSELNPIRDDTEDSLLSEETFESRTNLTDYADVSEISDRIDSTLQVQRKTEKKQKSGTESENESLEEGRRGNSIQTRKECSRKANESTTTDDLRMTPFQDIGLEENQRKPSPSSSENFASSEEDSTNSETPDDGFLSKKPENSDTLEDQSLKDKSENPETSNVSKTNKSSDNLESADEESAMDIDDNLEAFMDESKVCTSDCRQTSESGENIENNHSTNNLKSSLQPSKSQKRKLSTIYEEIVQPEKDAKRLRSDEERSSLN